MIRVVGGKYKRRILEQPDPSITRPTKDVAKEGLFSSLGDISKKSFLDLFGGSGAIAIEAFSRGANPVYVNDKNKEAIKIIDSNLEKLSINEIKVLSNDYLDALKFLNSKEMKFDIIFLDPPYKMVVDENFINAILLYNILNKDGIIVVETDYDIDKNIVEKYSVKILKYGRSLMNIIRGLKWKLQFIQEALIQLQMDT